VPADQDASGETQAHRLHNAVERGREDVSGLGERWLDAFVRIEDHAAAGGGVARLMVDAGLIVIVAPVSPFRADREHARSLFEPGEFHEISVDAPLATCEARDRKCLYIRAQRGELRNVTGIGSPYEPPGQPELRLDSATHSPEQCVDGVIGLLDALDAR